MRVQIGPQTRVFANIVTIVGLQLSVDIISSPFLLHFSKHLGPSVNFHRLASVDAVWLGDDAIGQIGTPSSKSRQQAAIRISSKADMEPALVSPRPPMAIGEQIESSPSLTREFLLGWFTCEDDALDVF